MRLSSNLDLAAARALLPVLREARGQPLALDAADVERFGAPCLQLLVAAKIAWAEDAMDFQILAPSPAFVAAATLMGFDHNLDLV